MRTRLTCTLVSVVGVLSTVALLLPVGSSAVAAPVAPSLTITPLTGPAGTTLHVTGSGCPDSSWDTSLTWRIHVQTQPQGSTPAAGVITEPSGTPTNPIAFPAIGYPGVATVTATPAPDGSWAADLTIPATGALAAVPGNYPVGAVCYATEGIEAGTIVYAAATFVVPDTPPQAPIAPLPIPAVPGFTG